MHAVRHHSLSFFRVRFHDSPSPARNTVVLLLVVCVYIRGRIHFHRNFIFVLYSFQLGVAFVYPKREAIPLKLETSRSSKICFQRTSSLCSMFARESSTSIRGERACLCNIRVKHHIEHPHDSMRHVCVSRRK